MFSRNLHLGSLCFVLFMLLTLVPVVGAQMLTYTVADGLVGPVVPVIFQDSRGILWFGSESGGVSRFDGNTFLQFPDENRLLFGETQDIAEDKWGNIWFLTRHASESVGNVSLYDYGQQKLQHIGGGNCLAVDAQGHVWVGGPGSLVQYTVTNRQDGPRPHPVSIADVPDAKINVIFQSGDGELYFGGNDEVGALILKFRSPENAWQPVSAQRIDTPSNLPKGLSIKAITEDPEGNLWFGGRGLLLRFDKAQQQFQKVLAGRGNRPRPGQGNAFRPPGQTTDRKVSLQLDSQNRIWFSDNQRLRWWDGTQLRRLQNVASEVNQGFYLQGSFQIEDAWGNLWFASETGAHQYDKKLIQSTAETVFEQDAPPTAPAKIAQKIYRVDDGLGSDNIQTIFEAIDGKIWFGHDNGVTVFDPLPAIVNHTTRAILGSNSVRLMYPDSTGTLWLSIPGGVARYVPQEGKLFHYDLEERVETGNDDTPSRFRNRRIEISKIFEAAGNIWFISKPTHPRGTLAHYRIFRYRTGNFEQLSLKIRTEIGPGGEVLHTNTEPLISSGTPSWISLGGWLFLPSRTGLQWLSPTGIHTLSFQYPHSLPHAASTITALYTDNQNRLWCYLETGEVKRYPNIRNRRRAPKTVINPEVFPLSSVIAIPSMSEGEAVKWFFDTANQQLVYWDASLPEPTPTALEEEAGGPPLLAVQTAPEAEKSQAEVTTFLFRDGIRTYRSNQLQHTVPVEIDEIRGALTTTAGDLWLATAHGALRYDGDTAKMYTTADGFLVDDLRDVHEDSWGNLWFATWGGGVVRYNGETFEPLTTKDGLVHNNVSSIHESDEKHLWFATEGGATQYRPDRGALPFCRIVSLDADKTYTEAPYIIPPGQDVTFHFQGSSPLRDNVTYQFRLLGIDNRVWTSSLTEAGQPEAAEFTGGVEQRFHPQQTGVEKNLPHVRYKGLKSGNYAFVIKAFRDGWPYTHPPAVFNFTIDQPFWTLWRNYLPTLIFLSAFGALVFRLIINRRRNAQLRLEIREREEAELQRIRDELNEAQNIQMGLLPTAALDTKGFDVAGMSVPATQVGGDFYDYLTVANGQTAIAVADAAGKGLRGAMNAVLTNGMLHEVARFRAEANVILTELNAGLAPRMYGPSFIALNLAILDESQKQVDYANGGQPYPILKRGDDIIEIENSDLPLGSMRRVKYDSFTFDLAEGDILIFHTDGLIEALNADEDMYGTERLKQIVSEIPDDANAEAVIEHIVEDVHNFVGEAEQYDDLTLVVIKRLQS